jgi:hypothetical protein
MIETSERPLREIRISKDNLDNNIFNWVHIAAKFYQSGNPDNEYILLLPHPKHKVLGGMDIDEFLSDCPETLSIILREIYNQRVLDRESGTWNSEIDLDNDFGFILIAFV